MAYNEAQLLEFLESEPGTERAVFSSIVAKSRKNTKQKAFIPRSAVGSALQAFIDIDGDPSDKLTLEEVKDRFGANEIRDLLWLGLIKIQENRVTSSNPYTHLKSAESFKAIVSKQNTVQFTRNILEDDPNIYAMQIGEEIEKLLERSWKDATRQSAGHRLRSWTGFVFRELVSTETTTPMFAYVNNSDVERRKKGRPTLMTGAMLEKIATLKANGLSVTEIANQAGISVQVITNYKAKYPDKWSKLGN